MAADGGVFAFGDAAFMGSMASQPLNAPIVGIAATADNQGYFLAASDGGVFAFGDAQFQGSMSGKALTRPIVGVAVDGATFGYWLVGGDGGVFSFGSPFLGSTGALHLNAPVVGLAATADDLGYRWSEPTAASSHSAQPSSLGRWPEGPSTSRWSVSLRLDDHRVTRPAQPHGAGRP